MPPGRPQSCPAVIPDRNWSSSCAKWCGHAGPVGRSPGLAAICSEPGRDADHCSDPVTRWRRSVMIEVAEVFIWNNKAYLPVLGKTEVGFFWEAGPLLTSELTVDALTAAWRKSSGLATLRCGTRPRPSSANRHLFRRRSVYAVGRKWRRPVLSVLESGGQRRKSLRLFLHGERRTSRRLILPIRGNFPWRPH